MTELQQELFSLQDYKYKQFHSKLMPTVSPETIIGIRTPVLRKFAKDFSKREYATDFLNTVPHFYYEENNLHAFLIEFIKDFESALYETEKFLPHINNWATCDMFRPKVFKKNTDKLYINIEHWLKSDKTYTVRYGIGMLLSFYLDNEFDEKHLSLVSEIRSDEYYVNMMIAWYFATALAKQYDSAIKYITDQKLSPWVHNKTIQKSVESYRISPEIKSYLKQMKITD